MTRVLTPEQKAASNARVRAWKRANRGRVLEQSRDYMRDYNKRYREANKAGLAEKRQAAYMADPDAARGRRLDYYAKNRDAERERQRVYAEKNSAAAVARAAAWAKNNPEKAAASRNASSAIRRTRHVVWADKAACKAFYDIAARVSACTGIKFEVDHIYPLRGKKLSGLHVPWNLRVVPKTVNRRKANKVMGEVP